MSQFDRNLLDRNLLDRNLPTDTAVDDYSDSLSSAVTPNMFLEETDSQPALSDPAGDIREKIEIAEAALQECSDNIAALLGRSNGDFYRALSHLYEVCLAFDQDPAMRKSFLKERKVKEHGLCQNPEQPVVKGFLRGKHQECRSAATKIAGAIALAKREHVRPKEFVAFIATETLSGAYSRYRKLSKPTQSQKLEAARHRRKAIDAYVGHARSSAYGSNQHTIGRKGRVLLLAEVEPAGEFRVLRAIEMDPKQLDCYLASKARQVA